MGKGGKKLNPSPAIGTRITATGRGSADEVDGATMHVRLAIGTEGTVTLHLPVVFLPVDAMGTRG